MKILEIEQAFQKEEELIKVLELCKEDFEQIDYYAESILKSQLAENAEEAKKALLALAGVYSNLSVVLSVAETEKKNREIREYERLRIETENAGNKFTSAVADKQASVSVASYRRVRNIIQGYLAGCEKQIGALQSALKNENRGYNIQQD